MKEIYSNVTKVMIDAKQGSNLLYLPLEKIMQLSAQSSNSGASNNNSSSNAQGGSSQSAGSSGSASGLVDPNENSSSVDLRARESRGRERDVR